MNICVIGLGKIGLPLSVHFAKMGNFVTGADINGETVMLVNSGKEPFPEEENLQEFLSEVVTNGSLVATTDNASAVANSDVVIVVVPLFVDSRAIPDFRALDSVTIDIARELKKGMLISYETTLPIGTTRERFLPVLEEISGLKAGTDFNLVFSPERVLTGRVFKDLRRYPKIVGGVSKECTQRGVDFYSKVLEFDERQDLPRPNGVWPVSSSESSEFVKLAETTYRDVNIGLANQFASYAANKDLNIHEIIEASNSQPFSHIHTPGISVGGHCIPIYPHFYIWNDPEATIVKAAREVNSKMPINAIEKLETIAGPLAGLTIAIYGISYRPGVKETAFSGALELRDQLLNRGAKVLALDPLYSNLEINQLGFRPLENRDSVEIIIFHTFHLEFSEIDFNSFKNLKYILDGRNIFSRTLEINGVEMIRL